ncbi:hypothetical protein HOY80DRAFT_893355 [Tuber brumale]|nr:hypothetical protein HOY80DRAFT_893355 [Tuber brumale]
MAKVKLVMRPSPPSVIVSTTATAASAVARPPGHHRKNARVTFDDYFDEEPIPEDPEPEHEPEPEPEEEEADQEQKLRKREKARKKTLAKLAGEYRREEDSDPDTESVFDFKAAFQNLVAPRTTSPSSFLGESLSSHQAENTPKEHSPPLVVRPYSGYDQRIVVPGDITGSWILEERNCHHSDDTFNNRDNQDQQIANLKRELEAVAKSDKHTKNSSTNSSQLTNNQFSWINNSDTNTEYSTSISPTTSPIATATKSPRRYPRSGASVNQNAYPYPPSCTSPPVPGIEAAIANHPLSIFDTHSSSQTSTTATDVGKKHRAKKSLWGGKKTQEEAHVEEAVRDGNEKKGWKNSIKKSAIAKFLMGGD